MANSNLILKNATATTDEASITLNVQDVFFIANDTVNGGDLYVSFNESIASGAEYLVLKSSEKFENLNIPCGTIYIKSSTGSVACRIYCRKYLR